MKTKLSWGLMAVMALIGGGAFAEDAAERSTYDKIWDSVSYGNNDAKVLQQLAFTGRLQGDAYSFHSEDNSTESLAWRRLRLGFKATVFQDFVLHSELDLDMNEADNDSWDDFYKRLTDSYLGWYPSKKAQFKVGKQSAGFTLDGATSSKKLIVPERSIVAGNLWFPTEYFTGATGFGTLDGWNYKVGGFSASGEPELGHFDSGYFILLSGGVDVGERGELRLDYVYNDPDYSSRVDYGKEGVGTRDLEHVVALVYKQMFTKKLGLWTDLAGGKGITDADHGVNQGDLLGIEVMPFYNFTDALQLVFQYAGVTSLDHQSDVRMSRYAGKNADDQVETAHNVLLGFNWYLYGHKLKWQNAVEYNHGTHLSGSGDDYPGYGLTSAVRLSW